MTEEQIVKQFADLMLKKIELRHNRYAPLGWKTMDKKRIMTLLKGELDEYLEDNNPEELIDVANYAMFLYNISI